MSNFYKPKTKPFLMLEESDQMLCNHYVFNYRKVMFNFFRVILILFLFLPKYNFIALASCNIYYVDFNYIGLEKGTSKRPFTALKNAISIAKPGDKIYIKEGVYTIPKSKIDLIEVKDFHPSRNCPNQLNSEMLSITIDPEAKTKVVFKASGDFYGQSFLNIRDSSCINFDGNNNLLIDGIEADIDINDSLVSIFSYKTIIRNIVVQGIEVMNSKGRAISFHQLNDFSPSYIVIRGNKIHDISQRAIGGFGNTVLIENNTIWNAGMSNFNQAYGFEGWPGIIQTSRLFDENKRNYIYSKNITISNNIIHDSWGEGIIMNFTVNGKITQNTIYDVFSVYVYIGISKNIIVDKNHLYRATATYDRNDKAVPIGNGITIAAEPFVWIDNNAPITIKNIRISNNLIDNLGKGVNFWHDRRNVNFTNSYQNILILHNILRNLHNTPIFIDHVPDNYKKPQNGQIRNNIIQNTNRYSSGTYAIKDDRTWVFSNNNWTGGLPFLGMHKDSHGGPPGFAGIDLNIGSDAENFKLSPKSKNIAAGVGTQVTEDYWGTVRSSITPSIGIHEFETIFTPSVEFLKN